MCNKLLYRKGWQHNIITHQINCIWYVVPLKVGAEPQKATFLITTLRIPQLAWPVTSGICSKAATQDDGSAAIYAIQYHTMVAGTEQKHLFGHRELLCKLTST